MKTTRIVLVTLGLAAGVFGLILAVPLVLTWPDVAVWLIVPPVAHDFVAVPVALAVLLLLRKVSRRRKAVLGAAFAACVVMVVLAIPVLWRADAGAPNPGLDDRDYPIGVPVLLLVIWAVAALAALPSPAALLRKGRGPSRKA